jgi:hypothetical protein
MKEPYRIEFPKMVPKQMEPLSTSNKSATWNELGEINGKMIGYKSGFIRSRFQSEIENNKDGDIWIWKSPGKTNFWNFNWTETIIIKSLNER